jgi:hypothetical protein
MLDEDLACIRAHRNNIHRYRGLLKTRLSDLERQFVERRLAEEKTSLKAVASKTFPAAFTAKALLPQQARRVTAFRDYLAEQ